MNGEIGGRVIWYLDVVREGLTKGLAGAKKEVQQFGDEADKTGKKVATSFGDKQSRSFGSFSYAVAGATVAVGAFLRSTLNAAAQTESAFAGLASSARAYNEDVAKSFVAAKDLSADGLINVTTAAQGLQKLFQAGLGLDEATQLMEGYKDQAAFGRSNTISFDQAVGNLAESFYTENSMIGNLSGQTENYTKILEIGAKQMGKNVNNLSDAERTQAKYIGTMQLAKVVQGDAAKSANTYSGQVAQLNKVFFDVKTNIGNIVKGILTPYIQKIKESGQANAGVITSFVIAGAAAVGFAAAVVTVAGAIALALSIMGGPFTLLLIALSVLLGKVVFDAVQKVQTKFTDFTKAFMGGAANIGAAAKDGLGGASKEAVELAEKLADVDEQIAKSKRNFTEQLAELIRDTKKRVATLEEEFALENSTFIKDSERRTKKLQEENEAAENAHKKRVDSIMKQIKDQTKLDDYAQKARVENAQRAYDKELAKGTGANQTLLKSLLTRLTGEKAALNSTNSEKLTDLQRQLDEENAQHKTEQERRLAEYNEDVAAAKAAHDKKVADTQAQLSQEKGLLERHSADVLAVRGFQYRDEIQKLRDNHTEELAAYDKQKRSIIKSAQEAAGGVAGQFNSIGGLIDKNGLNSVTSGLGTNMGSEMGSAFLQAMKESVTSLPGKIVGWFKGAWTKDNIGAVKDVFSYLFVGSGSNLSENDKSGQNILKQLFGRASGGPVSSGSPYVVGERGPELFVPDGNGSIMRNSDTVPLLNGQAGGGGGNTYNIGITVNANGKGANGKGIGTQLGQELIQVLNGAL